MNRNQTSSYNPQVSDNPSNGTSTEIKISSEASGTGYFRGRAIRPAPSSPVLSPQQIKGYPILEEFKHIDWKQTRSKIPRQRSISPCDKSLNTWADGEEPPPTVWVDKWRVRKPEDEVWKVSEDGKGAKEDEEVKAKPEAESKKSEAGLKEPRDHQNALLVQTKTIPEAPQAKARAWLKAVYAFCAAKSSNPLRILPFMKAKPRQPKDTSLLLKVKPEHDEMSQESQGECNMEESGEDVI